MPTLIGPTSQPFDTMVDPSMFDTPETNTNHDVEWATKSDTGAFCEKKPIFANNNGPLSF